jgi:hypothetical protein
LKSKANEEVINGYVAETDYSGVKWPVVTAFVLDKFQRSGWTA